MLHNITFCVNAVMRYDRHDCIGASLKQTLKMYREVARYLSQVYPYFAEIPRVFTQSIIHYVIKPRYSLVKSYLYISFVGTTVRQKTDSL